jgi:hypothetical protein
MLDPVHANPVAGPAPIIVAALFGDADLAYLDGLRRTHFPPERNQLTAHLTMFHHLAPSLAGELDGWLRSEVRGNPAPKAQLAGLMNLGGGVAICVECTELAALRSRLAEAFRTMLTPQDAGGWRPHVTIQNKVTSAVARETLAKLSAGFRPAPLAIVGVASYYYRGGPWEPIARYRFG